MPTAYRLCRVLFLFSVLSWVSAIGAETESKSSRHQLIEHAIWRSGQSEWSHYKVQSPYQGFTLEGDGALHITSEPQGKAPERFRISLQRNLQGEKASILQQCDMHWDVRGEKMVKTSWMRGALPGKINRRDLRLLDGQYRLTSAEIGSDSLPSISLKAPLLLEEAAFFELRDWPLKPDFVREVWWLPVFKGEALPREASFARIEVQGSPQIRKDISVWQVKIKPAEGKGAEFWVQATGTRAVIEARLSDGSQWFLDKVSRL